jgi:hypothetical protein
MLEGLNIVQPLRDQKKCAVLAIFTRKSILINP